MLVQLHQIKQAQANLKGVINSTNLQFSQTFTDWTGNQIFLKPENLQKTGSFKIRGAYNKISSLSEKEKQAGVVAFSAGNHGGGTAYAARAHGVEAVVVMPDNPVPSKKNAIESYGAQTVEAGTDSIAMYEKALEFHEKHGMTMVHPFDDPYTIAGQGTIGLELIEEYPEVNAVIVPVSGGGLISGVATAVKEMKPNVKVIGVNTEGAMAMYESLKKGKPTEVDKVETIADGLMAKKPGDLTFAHTQQYVDDFVLVSEAEIAETVTILSERAKLVVEPSGAAALAAMLYHHTKLKNQKVAVLVTGGNINFELYASLVAKHQSKQQWDKQ